MRDLNYTPLDFSNVHGTPDAWIQVHVEIPKDGGPWRIARSDENDGQVVLHDPPDLSVVSDVVKFSNSSYVFVKIAGILPGGIEDCVDVNNGSHHLSVSAELFAPRGKYVATVKGGSHHVTLYGKITSGSETDIDLGNWSDQGKGRTTNVNLALQHANYAARIPVRVRVLHAWTPSHLVYGPYAIDTRFKGVFRPVYFLLKKLRLA